MGLFEFRVLGLDERDLSESAELEESDRGQRRPKIKHGPRSFLSGTKAVVLGTALGATMVVKTINDFYSVSPSAAIQPLSGRYAEPRTAFDLTGKLYVLPDTTIRLPDFSLLKPVGISRVRALQMWSRDAFPASVRDSSVFGIDYSGRFWIGSSGRYNFNLRSDDGAKLFIDGKLILDDDGTHPSMVQGGYLYLKRGWHTMRVPYFEAGLGSPAELGLAMFHGDR